MRDYGDHYDDYADDDGYDDTDSYYDDDDDCGGRCARLDDEFKGAIYGGEAYPQKKPPIDLIARWVGEGKDAVDDAEEASTEGKKEDEEILLSQVYALLQSGIAHLLAERMVLRLKTKTKGNRTITLSILCYPHEDANLTKYGKQQMKRLWKTAKTFIDDRIWEDQLDRVSCLKDEPFSYTIERPHIRITLDRDF